MCLAEYVQVARETWGSQKFQMPMEQELQVMWAHQPKLGTKLGSPIREIPDADCQCTVSCIGIYELNSRCL